MRWIIPPEDRPKHLRLMWHVLVALILAIFSRVFLRFDLIQTLGYGIAAYVLLNALNYRTMFRKSDAKRPTDKQS